jgi:hypothetical protein
VSLRFFILAILGEGDLCFDMFYSNTGVCCCCRVVAAAISVLLIAIMSRSGNAMIGNRQRRRVRPCCYKAFL